MSKNLFQEEEMDNGHKKLVSQTSIGFKGRKHGTLLIIVVLKAIVVFAYRWHHCVWGIKLVT